MWPACKDQSSKYIQEIMIFSSLFYHNLTIYTTPTKSSLLLQNLIGLLTEVRYHNLFWTENISEMIIKKNLKFKKEVGITIKSKETSIALHNYIAS